jgi:DNA-binding transcriptional LysR family regulator
LKGAVVQNDDGVIGNSDKATMSKDLEVRHCRVLVAVNDSGGVVAAARALGLSQSTVSETLLSLERVLGAPVTLRRPGREAALTPAAEAILPQARALIAASETALAAFSMRGQETIRLGVVESIGSFLLPRPLSAFRQQWPGVDVKISIGLCEDLRKRVRRLELDAALTIEGAGRSFDGEGGPSRSLSPAQLRLVVSPHNSLGQRELGQADLAFRTFLLADPEGAFYGLLHAWFGDATRSPKFESAGSIDGVKRGVQNSDAIGVLPAYSVAEELSWGSLVELKVREPLPAIALLLTTPETPSESSSLHHLIEQIDGAFNAA